MCGKEYLMKKSWGQGVKKQTAVCLLGLTVLGLAACGNKKDTDRNLIQTEKEEKRIVRFYSPMEKTDPNAEKVNIVIICVRALSFFRN